MSEQSQTVTNTPLGQPKRRIRNLLIDRQFQLKWVTRIILIITVIVLIMGYFLYKTVADATDQMLAQKLGDLELTESSVKAFMTQAEHDKHLTIYKLAAWLIALAAFVSTATIILTHKVAGPIYKMRKIFRVVNDSNLYITERLRKGDELKEAFDDFDDMLRRLREKRRTDREVLCTVREILKDKDGQAQEVLKDLDAIIDKYQSSVQLNS